MIFEKIEDERVKLGNCPYRQVNYYDVYIQIARIIAAKMAAFVMYKLKQKIIENRIKENEEE
jgi:hypothetical protein